jgi:uncharacterized membrane protein YphA (DoxX/SURF4 family)
VNTATKVFLVLLRIAVGWHFLYEGIFKMEQDGFGPPAPGARHFLQTSVARLRESAGTLDGPGLASRVDAWNEEVQKFFKAQNNELSNEQRAALDQVCEQLKRDPAKVRELDWIYVHGDVLQVMPPPKAESFSSEGFLRASTGPFRGAFRGLISDADGLERLTRTDAERRLDERYAQILDHYESFDAAQRAGLAKVRDGLKQSVGATLDDPSFRTRVDDYRAMLARVAATKVRSAFEQERQTADRAKLDSTARQLLAFVEEPLEELAAQANAIARADQLAEGSPPQVASQTRVVDRMIMWSLALVGVCLLAGFLTEPAAVAGAAILAVFYLAAPPWPGLPAAGTEGHYIFVNRNLIEMFAVLLLMAARAGRWAGLDAWLKARPALRTLKPNWLKGAQHVTQ